MRKIAIVAFSAQSRGDAPYDDPAWEKWGMNNLHAVLPGEKLKGFTRWYDLHPRQYIDANNGRLQTDHLNWLRHTSIPVYMDRQYEDFPTSMPYPLEDVQDMMRHSLGFQGAEDRYLHSTPAFALAHAVLEGADEICIYGCDMAVDGEWGYQRANMEAWIAMARQQNALSNGGKLKVTVAEKCALLKGQGLYAYDDPAYAFSLKLEDKLRELVKVEEKSKAEAERRRQLAQIEMNTHDGCIQATNQVIEIIALMKRGWVP